MVVNKAESSSDELGVTPPQFLPKKQRYYSRLRRRRLLRHPLVIFSGYLLLLSFICILGTKTVWFGYHWYQVPSLLSTLVSSIVAVLVGLGIPAVIGPALGFGRFNPKREISRYYRHGGITLAVLGLAFTSGITAIVYPSPRPVERLFSELELPAHRLEGAKSQLTALRDLPLFKNSAYVKLASLAIDFKENAKTWDEGAYESARLGSKEFLVDPWPTAQAWAHFIYGEALLQTQRKSEAMRNYVAMTKIPDISTYLRFTAFYRLGFCNYIDSKYHEAAEAWLRAVEIMPSRGAYENLGWYYADVKGDFSEARRFHDLAAEELSKLRAANLIGREDEVRYYLNRANFERRFAEEAATSDVDKAAAYDSAWNHVNQAIELDRTYMDAYWTGTHLAFSQKRFERALRLLDEARATLVDFNVLGTSRHKDLEHPEYATPYTAWLYIRNRFHSQIALTKDQRAFILKAIPGLQSEPFEKLSHVLTMTDRKGYTVHDCMKALDDIKAAGVLAAIIEELKED